MTERELTLIEGTRVTRVPARIAEGRVRVAEVALEGALGWRLRPQGLCKGDVCVPVRDRAGVVAEGGIDLEAFARALDRPLALDREERVAVLGASADERRRSLASLEAPEFELPDLAGRLHRLSDQRGKKVLLIAYASW